MERNDSVWAGIGLTLGLHIVFGMIFMGILNLINPNWVLAVFYPGLTQLLYIVPLCLIFKKRGQVGMVKGLIIGAAITFLLNAACSGMFFLGGSRIGG